MNALSFEYDLATDIATIEGVKYSGDFFRFFAEAGQDFGEWFCIRRNGFGSVTIRRLEEAQSTQGAE